MKPISSYIKSKSVRKYYEKNNIKLNIVQAAFIIWHNEDILINERIECYKNIAETYDDMSVDTIENGDIHSIHISSFKEYIYTMINRLQNEYKEFIDNSHGSIYSINYSYLMKDIHDSYEETINYIKVNKDKYEKELMGDCLRIYKIKDKNNPSKHQSDYIELNGNLEIKKVHIFKIKPCVEDTNNIFDYLYIEMLHPFKRGDIVKDWYGHSIDYYCIDVMHYWDKEIFNKYKISENIFASNDESRKRMTSYPECMDFAGYIMRNDKKNTVFGYTAGDNPVYIDLEYASNSELTGNLKMLQLCSEYIKRIVNGKEQLTPLSIISYYKEIEARNKGKKKVVYNEPEDAYYEQFFAHPLTYL